MRLLLLIGMFGAGLAMLFSLLDGAVLDVVGCFSILIALLILYRQDTLPSLRNSLVAAAFVAIFISTQLFSRFAHART